MPIGPHGEKRPVSIVANARRIVDIATGLAEEEYITPEHARKHKELKRSLKNALPPKKKAKASKKKRKSSCARERLSKMK